MANSSPGEGNAPPPEDRRVVVSSESADIVTAVLIILAATWFVVEALGFPTRGNAWVQSYTFPIGIGIIGIAASGVLVLQAVLRIVRGARLEPVVFGKPHIVLLGMLSLVVYTLLLDALGYYITAALFILVFGYIAGVRKPLSLILLTAGLLIFTLVIFDMALSTPLPTRS